MIHFKLSSLKYCSKFITGQIIALFGFIQNKARVALKQIENMEAKHRDGIDLKEHIPALQTSKTSFEFLTEISIQSVKLKNSYFK